MAQTYRQLQQQIQTLQRKADELRSKELGGVVARIKEAIAHYGLTAAQLGFGGGKAKSVKSAVKSKRAAAAKYADGQGNTWGGMGPRPAWLRAALDSGKTLDDFRVGAATVPTSSPTKSSKSAKRGKAAKKRVAKAAYIDKETGNSWGGMGPRPRWLKEAIAAGKALEDFAA